MRFFKSGIWSYATLLVILFAIAALAAYETISYVGEHVPEDIFQIVATLIWALSLGFMFIAGAFGLWAIQFSAVSEGRRRIGRFVDAMDYLRDGLVVLDAKGRLTGSNPAISSLTDATVRSGQNIRDIFPCLFPEDIALLLDTSGPNEVERDTKLASGIRTLRFRSQPSEGLILLLVSDITTRHAQVQHSRQLARLQLIGQIARGVAHDFNNLLVSISGYASLLTRLKPGSPDGDKAITTILQNTERGIALAGHLSDLAHPNYMMRPTDAIKEHIEAALDLLKSTMISEWQVVPDIADDLPPTALTGLHIEQIVTNLALLVVDSTPAPSVLHIDVRRPGKDSPSGSADEFAALLTIYAGSMDSISRHEVAKPGDTSSREAGVIQSVIRSMVEEHDGRLESFMSEDGALAFRLAMPRGALIVDSGEETRLPDELKAYIASWSVLIAMPGREQGLLEKRMKDLGMKVSRVNNIMSALAFVEDNKSLDAMVIHRYLLGNESRPILKAVMKLHPSAGIVVICEEPSTESEGLLSDVVFLDTHSGADKILISTIEAKNLAMRRIHNPGSAGKISV